MNEEQRHKTLCDSGIQELLDLTKEKRTTTKRAIGNGESSAKASEKREFWTNDVFCGIPCLRFTLWDITDEKEAQRSRVEDTIFRSAYQFKAYYAFGCRVEDQTQHLAQIVFYAKRIEAQRFYGRLFVLLRKSLSLPKLVAD